jgi:DNA-binding NarL/FixJ family response regulator
MIGQARIRVLCVDDHRIVREGLTLILGQYPDIEVVGSAMSGEDAIRMFSDLRPDVTIMDLQMAPVSGVDAIRAIRRIDPHARIVVLTMYGGDEDIHQALAAGAAAYLLKNTMSPELVGVIRDLHQGRRPIMNPELRSRLEERDGRSHITPRETQVLDLISHGLRDKEIAGAMGISEHTVYAHVKHILLKLGVKDRTAAIRTAVERGIIRL